MKRLRRLNGTSEEARIINDIIAAIEEITVRAGPGIQVRGGSRGRSIIAEPPKGGGVPISDWYQGDWDPTSNYLTGHGVSIRGGLTAGLYIAIQDAPSGTAAPTPASTTTWIQVASHNAMGHWI